MKPGDVFSETLRKSVNDWYDNTLLSRLNNKQDGVIIVVMQRLHQDDLVGHLLEPDKWDVLRFPAIAEEDDCMSWRPSSVQFNLSEKPGKCSMLNGRHSRRSTVYRSLWATMHSKVSMRSPSGSSRCFSSSLPNGLVPRPSQSPEVNRAKDCQTKFRSARLRLLTYREHFESNEKECVSGRNRWS
jgi:hypothetical protein